MESDDDAHEQMLARTRQLQPDPTAFEYVGEVTFDSRDLATAVADAAHSNLRRAADTERPDSQQREEEFDPALDQGLLVSADGRAFRERGPRHAPTGRGAPRYTSVRDVTTTQQIGNAQEATRDDLWGRLSPESLSNECVATMGAHQGTLTYGDDVAKVIKGHDGRRLVTSSAYPWRAAGVGIFESGSQFIRGSGCMIGPRHVLTAAHVVNGSGTEASLIKVVAAPGARGFNYTGARYPYGRRQVQWYYWPHGWRGGKGLSSLRYDYALLVLEDLPVSPGWLRFGYQSATWTDYRYFNTAGYPGTNFVCADSPLGGASHCGGYMYRQYERVTAVFPGYFYHAFDISKGQSGSPVYWYDGKTRIVYGMINAEGLTTNLGHRIREGSYNSLCSWISGFPSEHFPNVQC